MRLLLLTHHLIELVERDLLLIQLHDVLHRGDELLVNGTINKALNVVFLLQHFLNIVVEILIGNVRHAILGELGTGSLASGTLNLVVVDLDVVGSHELLLDQVPSQLLDATLVVLLHIVVALVLIVLLHDALQQLIGPCQLTGLLLAVCTQVLQELPIAVLLQLSLNLGSHALTELFLVLHSILAIDLVEQLLIDLCRSETADFGNLIGEVARVETKVGLVDLQERSQLSVALVSLAGIEGDER